MELKRTEGEKVGVPIAECGMRNGEWGMGNREKRGAALSAETLLMKGEQISLLS